MNNGNWLVPEVGDTKNCGTSVAAKKVRDCVTSNFALRTDGVVRFTNFHLVVV